MSMATRSDDRVSSARLLDMLKGLQESRHLGSEPEVETETIEHPAIVNPKAGTYQTAEALQGAFTLTQAELASLNVPITVYSEYVDMANMSFPITVPIGETTVATLTKIGEYNGTTPSYFEGSYTGELETYTGYVASDMGYGQVIALYVENGNPDNNSYHIWSTEATTETITTKTKRTIKQDYVPNADWNQNDPDGEGYVQGRTHWVEGTMTGIIPEAGTYNSLEEFQTQLNSVEPSVVYVCDAYPQDWDGATFPVTLDDYDGEPVAVLDKEFNIEGLRVLGPSDWDGNFSNLPEYLFIFKQEPYYQANTVMKLTTNKYYRWKGVAETVHKLDRKFYDYVNENAVKDEILNSTKAIIDENTISLQPNDTACIPYSTFALNFLKKQLIEGEYIISGENMSHRTRAIICTNTYPNTLYDAVKNGYFFLYDSSARYIIVGKQFKIPSITYTKVNMTTLFETSGISNGDGSGTGYVIETSKDNTSADAMPTNWSYYYSNYNTATLDRVALNIVNNVPEKAMILTDNSNNPTRYSASIEQPKAFGVSYSTGYLNKWIQMYDTEGYCYKSYAVLLPMKLTTTNFVYTVQGHYECFYNGQTFDYYWKDNRFDLVNRGVGTIEVTKDANAHSGTVKFKFENDVSDISVWIPAIECVPHSPLKGTYQNGGNAKWIPDFLVN